MFQEVPGLAYDGILSGGTMIADDLDMDFGAMRLNFFSADHCEGDVVYWPHQALAVVPVNLASGHFEIATTLDGHPLTAVIDTGSPWTILSAQWAKENLAFSPDTGAAFSTAAASSANVHCLPAAASRTANSSRFSFAISRHRS